jgi:hypothetical protein
MFTSVAGYRVGDPAMPAYAPGTSADFNLPGTVDLALKLNPEARRLVMIVGSAPYDQRWQALAPPQVEKYRKQLDIEMWEGRPLDELDQRVAALRPDTILVYLTMYRDSRAGLCLHEVAKNCRNTPGTVYSIIKFGGRLGALGGYVVNWNGQHDAVGALHAGCSPGNRANPSAPPVPAECRIDWHQLKRWKIAESLPKTARCWTRAVALERVLLQAAVIALLLRQRRERQSLAGGTSTHPAHRLAPFDGLPWARPSREINQPLTSIHANASAGVAMLDSQSAARGVRRFNDIRRDDKRGENSS